MSLEKVFMRPKLKGQRFEDHRLPVSIMEDFSVLEELIFDLAKKIYIDQNPERKRVPNHFTENVSLKLSRLDDGSVIPNFLLVAAINLSNPTLPDVSNDYFRYFESARDKVYELVESANQGDVSDLNPKFLNYFNRIGRNLRDDESIDFINDSGSSRNVVFNKVTRQKILLSRSDKSEYSDVVNEIVLIPSVDKKKKKFQIELDSLSPTLEFRLRKDFQDTVLTALQGYDDKCYVSLKGIGTFNENMKLIQIDRIDSIDLLDPFDVSIRLRQLSQLEDNWYNGEEGERLNNNALNTFEDFFFLNYGDDLPLPAIFPTLKGDLLLEWKIKDISISLEVSLLDFNSTLYYFDMLNDLNDLEVELNLKVVEDWTKINQIIQKAK
ncbi:hypothetical protein [Flavobacterium hungaricum]|uniref:Uncharacterized protein n=1 Tax=Flavobacterium hungaricum TaxID=2082725 RepID=A0ABR9TFS5_9FLAO|nr:hypothetical protein [Flavobacterium hungaricum]MBE8723532.1 hypothetical protein [Flavobacterium hungaricum]